MVSPFDAVRANLQKAELQIEQPRLGESASRIPVHFNPTEYQTQKQNKFADINIPGLETPPIQFVRGEGEKLSTELLVDTSDTLEDVRERYVNRLRGLMNIHSELHAPPILRFVWDQDLLFRGVLESLRITYTMFRPDGVPLRAKLSVTLKEYRPVEVQLATPRNSPDVEKAYTVQRGDDTLAAIAFRVFRDETKWRAIAEANDIRDPRTLTPGQVLVIPKLI